MRALCLWLILLTSVSIASADGELLPRTGPLGFGEEWRGRELLSQLPTVFDAGNRTEASVPPLRISRANETGKLNARDFAWIALEAATVGLAFSVKYELDARTALDDRNAEYEAYSEAYSSADATYYWQRHQAAEARYDGAAHKRNVFLGIAAGALGLSVVLFAF